MRTRNGGQEAKAGFWWNTGAWEITLVKATGDALPGGPAEKFVRVPTLALVLLGPLMGALFVMFLPLIGFAMLFGAVANRVGRNVAATGRSLAEAMHFGREHHATPAGTRAPEHHDHPAAKNETPESR